MSVGKWKRAEAAYRAASAEDVAGDARGAAGLGDALFRQGKAGEADEAYARAMELEPGNPRLLNNRAYAMAAGGGDPAAALELAERACETRPRNPRYLETAAAALMAAGRPEEAARRLERAWGLAERETPEARREIMEGLARAWLAAGRESLAWQAWQAREREFPWMAPPKDLLEQWPFLGKKGGRPERLGR
jgi:tetratricopeptide (TPR) repeat protein